MRQSNSILYKFVLLCFVLGFSLFSTAASAGPLSGLTVICDLDYTLLDHDSLEEAARSQRRSWLHQFVRNVFVPPKAVSGMVEVLKLLESKGATIQFVSARKHSQYDFLRKTLDALNFPNAKLQLAEYIPHGGELMYKYEYISFMIKSNPRQKYFLIGDNQDRDPKIFDRLVSEPGTKEKIAGIFIRKVRRSDPNRPRRTDLFSDGFHLAQILTQVGFISDTDLERILPNGTSQSCQSLFVN